MIVSGCGSQAVPSELELYADKVEIIADGLDAVQFSVFQDGEDVTSRASLYVDGGISSSFTFSTASPGTYVFKARLGDITSDPVSVTALDSGSSGGSSFVKQVSLMEFTGAWCTMCPEGYTTMNFLLSTNTVYAENVHVLAFHSDSAGEDALAIDETESLMGFVGVDVFPSFTVDMRQGSAIDGASLRASLDAALYSDPVTCGVAVSSALHDGEALITVRLHSEINSIWRTVVYIVEDKVIYYQKDGTVTHDRYTHRHVVRRMVSSSIHGDRVGDGIVTSGNEAYAEYRVKLDPDWNLENTFVYVLALDRDGVVDNMNCCLLNDGEADYLRNNLL